MKKRLGILGAGRIGQVHARAIAQNNDVALTAVTDTLPEAAQTLAKCQ